MRIVWINHRLLLIVFAAVLVSLGSQKIGSSEELPNQNQEKANELPIKLQKMIDSYDPKVNTDKEYAFLKTVTGVTDRERSLAQLPQQLWRESANRWVFAFSFPLHLV